MYRHPFHTLGLCTTTHLMRRSSTAAWVATEPPMLTPHTPIRSGCTSGRVCR